MIGSNQEITYKVRAWNRLGILSLALAIAPLSGASFKDLATFNGTNGAEPLPSAALIQGTDGNLYGTTYTGGTNTYDAVFQVTPAGPSRPGELRPEPLTEPCVNLSIYTARATERRLPPSVQHRVLPVSS